MKYFLFILLLGTQFSFAQEVSSLPCYSQFQKLLQEWKAEGEWRKEFQGGLNKAMFVSPTKTFGEWALVRAIDGGTVVARANQKGRLEVSFKTDKCVKEVKPYTHDKTSASFINDKEIHKFITIHKQGAIYVWSPRMGLSVNGIKEIQAATKTMKIPVLILLDKEVSDKEIVLLKKDQKADVLKRVDSFDFKMRNISMHFPALVVFKNGKILSGVKYGYEKAEAYQLDLRNMLR